jgi:nucleoside-diphosphate-sugar epimerase
LAHIAREKGVSAYIGEGLNRWPAVHRLDAGKLVQLAIDRAPAGVVLHAVAEEGIATRDIAAAIGKYLKLPEATVPADRATEHFDWLGMFFGADAPASSELTRALVGWEPKHPALLEDIAAGHYSGR